jgi:hypothetical protein
LSPQFIARYRLHRRSKSLACQTIHSHRALDSPRDLELRTFGARYRQAGGRRASGENLGKKACRCLYMSSKPPQVSADRRGLRLRIAVRALSDRIV